MKIRNRNFTDLSPQLHALHSSLRSYNAKQRIKRQIAVISDTTSCFTVRTRTLTAQTKTSRGKQKLSRRKWLCIRSSGYSVTHFMA